VKRVRGRKRNDKRKETYNKKDEENGKAFCGSGMWSTAGDEK